jgi:hypothetical protein
MNRVKDRRVQALVAMLIMFVTVSCQGCNRTKNNTGATSNTTNVIGAPGTEIYLVHMDAQGKVSNPAELTGLSSVIKEKGATDVFIMAHGWNNSEADAQDSYKAMTDLVRKASQEKPELVPTKFVPVRVGIIWPSKALDEDATPEAAVDRPLSENDKQIIRDVFPAEEDQKTILELSQKKKNELKPEDWAKANSIMQKNAIPPNSLKHPASDDGSVFDAKPAPEAPISPLQIRFGKYSIADAVRVFTFWQMKKRAGIVGEHGGREILHAVHAASPSVRAHMFGHSFGCKLVLSALLATSSSGTARPVQTVVLIQPAISYQAFADTVTGTQQPGGYKAALKSLKGPAVATFSKFDIPLNRFYPLGASFLGVGGDLETPEAALDQFRAMGAVGIDAVTPISMRHVKEQYTFGDDTKLYSIASSDFIAGHSAIRTPEVAWMIWSAVVRK